MMIVPGEPGKKLGNIVFHSISGNPEIESQNELICRMLTNDMLFFHTAAQGRMAILEVLDWLRENREDPAIMWERMKILQAAIENTHPTQKNFQAVIDTNIFTGMDEHLDLFTSLPWPDAIRQLYQLPQDKWMANCWVLFTFFRNFDDKQFNAHCRNGCEHEWHQLQKIIRTEDIQRLVEFYTSLGLKFTHKQRHNSEHYQGFAGQSELLIYRITKSTRNQAALHLHLRFRIPGFDELTESLKKQEIPFTISSAGQGTVRSATLRDPDGRTVTLYDAI